MGPTPRFPSLFRRRGFTLIEVVVVLLIFGIVVAMAAAITRGVVAAQKRSVTSTRMAAVDAALVQFVLQQKRLPCPADGTELSTSNSAGTEDVTAGACTGNQVNGVVPWRSLGLTEADATDGWDRRFTYRTQPDLTLANGMDMSWCDPAGSGPAVGANNSCNNAGNCNSSSSAGLALCTPPSAFLANKGLRVQNVAGTVVHMDPAAAPHTGAAYVLISHGESGGGGYLGSGQLGVSSVGDGTEEMKNYASQAYVAGVTYYVDDTLNETADASHFDDVVSRPSLLSVITKAGLGPRTH